MPDHGVPPTSRRALRARYQAMQAPDAALENARAVATEAARGAGIAVHEVQALADLSAVRRLFDTLWGSDPTNPAVTVELLRAYAHSGQYVVIATDLTEDGRPVVAAGVAFLAAPAGGTLHSHVVGVQPHGRGRAIGFALKAHQRVWAMERQLTRVTWTYDPLIRRNAWFNLAKLGARASEYLDDFYGPMADGINAGDASDRVLVSWPLYAPEVEQALAGRPVLPDVPALRSAGAVVLLSAASDGRTPLGPVAPPVDPRVRVALAQVPPDIETLRREDPGLGRAWRQALRRVLHGGLDSGWSIVGFSRDGWYVLQRPDRPATGAPEGSA